MTVEKTEKKEITKNYTVTLGPKILNGDINGVAARIIVKIKSVLDTIPYDSKTCSIKLVNCNTEGYYYSNRRNRYNIVVTRTETDEEFATRIKIKKERNQREATKARARREANRKREALAKLRSATVSAAKAKREESEERQLLKLLKAKYDTKVK